METFRADILAANDNRNNRKWRILLAVLAILLTISTIGYFQARAYLFDGLPSLPDKKTMWEMNLQPNITLLDKDGRVIGHRGPHIGRPLKLKEMPGYLPAAFLAIEDERFYQHPGIDRKAIIRALFENTKSGKKVQGGSTLTQQLVKNMLLTPDRTYQRKFQEMWLAYEMEQLLSKPEILELYLNRIDLGARTFGVEAASQRYFGKSAVDLTLSESALLAGLPKAPSRYDPTRNFDGAWARGKLVLQSMAANNMISVTDMAQAENNPPVLAGDVVMPIEAAKIGHVFDMVSERAQELVGHETKDLIVRTTLDPDIQEKAHKAIETIVSKSEKSRKVSEGALVAIENETGAVLALTGGRNYDESKFNRSVQAERQPGSSFKAFVYAAALETGYSPGTVRIDQPTTIGEWSPENYTKRYRGPMTMREALKHSINTIAAQVGAEVGPSKVAELGRRFGIQTQLRPHYSIALGASEVTLLDMTGAFTVFANDGLRRQPYVITSVANTQGDVLYSRKTIDPERVYAARYARQMTSMLRDVVATGTGHGAKIGRRELAGKTGTSQDHRDAWFIGFSADYTAGVWMGNDDNSPMVKVTGGLLPVDAWKLFMIDLHKGKKYKALTPPDEDLADDPKQELMNFYAGLLQDLVSERDLAAGITTAANTVSTAPITAEN